MKFAFTPRKNVLRFFEHLIRERARAQLGDTEVVDSGHASRLSTGQELEMGVRTLPMLMAEAEKRLEGGFAWLVK